MEPIDLRSIRNAKWINRLDELRQSEDNLETTHQIQGARQIIAEIDTPASPTEVTLLADALELAVIGHCNQNETSGACQLAEQTTELIYEYDPNRSLRWRRVGRAPRSLAAIRAARVYAQAIELDGDPDDAIHRLLALHLRLRQNPELGDGQPLGTGPDSLRVLRCVLSSVKREGSHASRNFADFARQQGDGLLDGLVDGFPEDCASYLHRAALERRIRQSAGAQREAAELLRRSLPLRRDTVRDRRSRGMAEGDLLVLRGEREAGAELLTRTVENFKPDLIRHHESAQQILVERDLLRAA
jgi:hypothetical protein